MVFLLKAKKITKEDILAKTIPRHIAIIMDGNGRWAQKKGLSRAVGHRMGVEALKKIVEFVLDINLQYLTVYAFSTENWKRPQAEINILMDLMIEYIVKEVNNLHKNGVKINPIGDLTKLPAKTIKYILDAKKKTSANQKLVFNVAINYGGRAEITQAVQRIAQEVREEKINIDTIDEELISLYLYTMGQPDPDLIIRPSGEMRISNFMLWQLAYSELWTTNVLWPDFKPQHLLEAISDFQNRNRRFGGIQSKN